MSLEAGSSAQRRFGDRQGQNRIECCFNKLKCRRHLAARHDGRAIRCLAFVHLAAPMLWMHEP